MELIGNSYWEIGGSATLGSRGRFLRFQRCAASIQQLARASQHSLLVIQPPPPSRAFFQLSTFNFQLSTFNFPTFRLSDFQLSDFKTSKRPAGPPPSPTQTSPACNSPRNVYEKPRPSAFFFPDFESTLSMLLRIDPDF